MFVLQGNVFLSDDLTLELVGIWARGRGDTGATDVTVPTSTVSTTSELVSTTGTGTSKGTVTKGLGSRVELRVGRLGVAIA
jgi:hypothetical protein